MEWLETSAGRVAYSVRGAGLPVVLLSAGAHDHRDYDELRKLLPPRFCSIAPDWPAHGQSSPAKAASAMAFADVAERLVATLAPDGAVVVGNSVGGFAAARLAIRQPDLVKGLVIIDGGGFLGRGPQVRMFCSLMSQPRFLRAIYPSFSARYMRAQTDADRRARTSAIATTRTDPGLRAVTELWRSFASAEHDLRGEAPNITVPTLVLWGRHDPVMPLRVGRWLGRTIPGAELAVFDSGHLPHTTDPAGVAERLVAFADRAFADSPGLAAAHQKESPSG